MSRFDGSLALTLDFGDITTTAAVHSRAGLRLAVVPSVARAARSLSGSTRTLAPSLSRGVGPDKYQDLEHRRRQAQIKARRLLDLMEGV